MPTSTITNDIIREMYNPDTYQKGLSYKRSGAVTALRWLGDTLEARVQGNQYEQYVVKIAFLGDRPVLSKCTCPIGTGCKHIVAALLEYAQSPEEVEAQPDIATLLAPLDRQQIESVLSALIERDNDLYDDLARQISLAMAKVDANHDEPLAPEKFRNAAHAAFQEAREMLNEYYDEMPDDDEARNLFFPLVEELEDVIKSGRASATLPALEAITVEFATAEARASEEDEDGASEGFWDDVTEALNDLWLHVALAVDLSSEDRLEWSRKLARWGNDTSYKDLFENARAALAHGWDDPILLRMLTTGEPVPEADDWEAEEVYDKRIAVLRQRGRAPEMLNLALAIGNHNAASLAYVSLGRTAEAADHGIAFITSEKEMLEVCQALYDAGAIDDALRLGEHGLTLPKPADTHYYYYRSTTGLSAWVRDIAHGAGNHSLELRATERAYDESPSLDDYERIEVLSGDRWPSKKVELLRRLFDRNVAPDAAVDIFLREERWNDALDAGERGAYGTALERAIRATLMHVPDRVIAITRKRAESIMNEAKASRYDSAVHWLRYVREAYNANNRPSEWTAYLRDLIVAHGRKYKLVPMLRELA